jgi:hypothetical protein
VGSEGKPSHSTPLRLRGRLAAAILATVAALVFGGILALGLILHRSPQALSRSHSPAPAASATAEATVTPSSTPAESATPEATTTPSPSASNGPSPRTGAGVAYDVARQALVVFGGYPGGGAAILADTWTLQGGQWHLMQPRVSPPARVGAIFVYDPVRKVTVLNGAQNTSPGRPNIADTWTWDGQTWSQVAVGSGPSLFTFMGAFDQARGVLVVFGVQFGGTPQTWTWDGSRWTQHKPVTSPPARGDGSMGYDPLSRRILLFGGHRDDTGVRGDTWLWDGSNWTEQHPAVAPSPRVGAAIASGQTLVLYGGGDLLSDTWIWTGSTWKQMTPAQNPGGRRPSGAGSNGTTVLIFGGELRTGSSSAVLTNDVWAWDGVNWNRLQ